MKLSDVKGERTFDVVADCIEPLINIAQDGESAAFFKREKPPKGTDAVQFALDKAKKSLPVLLRNHKADLCAIMATLKGMEPDEFEEQLNVATLVRDFTELMEDEAFVAFLS